MRVIYRKANNSDYSGELGDGGTRRVTITGSATLNTTLASVEEAESQLRTDFEAQGWNLINFNLTKTGYVFTISFDIEIIADVPDAYSNQQHLDEAYRIFNAYQLNYLIGSTRPITDLTLRISGADKPGANPVQYISPTVYTVNKTNSSGASSNSSGGAGNLTNYLPSSSNLLNPVAMFGIGGLSIGLVTAIVIGIIILRD